MIIPLLLHAASICAHHLCADDPYQFESYSIDQLISIYFSFKSAKPPIRSKVLEDEIRRRLNDPTTTDEQREILTKLTGITNNKEK